MASINGGGREWLQTHAEDIVVHLDPVKAVQRLRIVCPEGFDRTDQETVLGHSTSLERSEALLKILDTRPPEVSEALLKIVMTSHPRLAAIIQPVRFRVLWLCPSSQHAAMAVHVLETFSETKFLPVQDGGPNFLVRRGYAFGKKDMLIMVAFPVKPEFFSDMLSETIQQRDEEEIHLALLTGVCDAMVPRASVGQAVIPPSSEDGASVLRCHTADRVKNVTENLRERISRARWLSRLTEPGPYREAAYLDYCAARLGRLYVELCSGIWSEWLTQFGWQEGGDAQSERNRACLSAQFPDWESGKLARYVLRERQTWTTDPASPLGLAPKGGLLSRVIERKCWYNEFPSPIDLTPSGPVFNPLSPPGCGGDVTNTNTHKFYEACSRLESKIPWFACLCVCHDAVSSNHEHTAFTAVTMAMEVVQLIISE